MVMNVKESHGWTLDYLKDVQIGTVDGLRLQASSTVRLMEMGLFEGSRVTGCDAPPWATPWKSRSATSASACVGPKLLWSTIRCE
jgi:hypothetical protein